MWNQFCVDIQPKALIHFNETFHRGSDKNLIIGLIIPFEIGGH